MGGAPSPGEAQSRTRALRGGRGAGAATTALKGAFLLSTKTKALVVAGIALVALIAAWQVAFPRTEPPRAAAAAAAAPGKTTDEPSPEHDALPESVDFAAIDRERDLHGVVVTPDGRPVAGALVESVYYATRRFDNLFRRLRFDGEAGPQTRTALDGRFKLRLERGDMVYLRVSAEGYPPRELARHQAGERVRIVLSNGVRLVVRIRDESGRPVPKSRLEFLRAHPSSMLEIFARREAPQPRRLLLLGDQGASGRRTAAVSRGRRESRTQLTAPQAVGSSVLPRHTKIFKCLA